MKYIKNRKRSSRNTAKEILQIIDFVAFATES